MPDAQIHPTGTVSVPADYVIPGQAELLLKGVFAQFDGSAAAGSYQPLVRIISDAGSTVIEAVSDTTIAAGGSADASWFPHLAAAAASTPAASTGLPIAAMYSDPVGVSIAATGSPVYVSLHDGVSNAGFSTTDSTTFANLSSTLFTGSAVYGIGIQAAGTYAVLNNSFTFAGGSAGHSVTAYWAASNGSAPSFFQQGRSANTILDTFDKGQAGVGPHLFLHEWITVSAAQTPAVLAVYGQISGAVAGKASFQMMVVQMSTSVLAKL